MKKDPDYHSPKCAAAAAEAEAEAEAEDGRTCTTCATEDCVAADAPQEEAPASCNSSRELLERVFQLIQEGNVAKEQSRNYWLAADKYLQVYDVLQQLIQKMNDDNNNSHNIVDSRNGDDIIKIAIAINNNNSSHEEQEEETIELQPQLDSDFYKIRQLYYDQSIDYRHQIRQCFIRALQQGDEDANDDGNRITTLTTADTTTTTTTAITATVATSHEYRCNLLHRFYHNCHNQDHLVSHPQPYIPPVMDTKDRPTWNHTDAAIHHIHDVTATVVVQPGEPTLTSRPPNHHKDVTVTTTEDDAHNDDIDDAQQTMILQTLEQRLQQLRTSLPSYMKSESQLLQERNAQLQRLGIYTNTTTSSSNNNGDNTIRTNDAWAMHATPQQHHLLLPSGTTVSNNQENDAVDAIIAQVQEEIAMTLPKPMNHHTDHVPTLDDHDRTTTTERDQYLLYHQETTSSQSHASTTSSSSDHDSEDDEALIHDLLTNDNV
jgi:hypothetical protein